MTADSTADPHRLIPRYPAIPRNSPSLRVTRAHEIWAGIGLWAKEHLALFHAEMLEGLPREDAPPQEFLDHALRTVAGAFDIWADAFFRSAVPTDDSALAFENLLSEVEESMLAQVKVFRFHFIPKPIISSEMTAQLTQRKQYWIGRMLRRVREHQEASRANPAPPPPAQFPTVANEVTGGCPTTVPVPEADPTWNERLRAARERAHLSRPQVVNRLKNLGIQITADAIKKHEEGKAKPKPPVRRAYTAIYSNCEGVLFPD